MPLSIIVLIGVCILLLGWIAVGYIGSRVEQLKYTVLDSSKEYEIRLLDDHVIAETEVSGGFKNATNEGFSIIANYIFGGNTSKESIAMTTPVVTTESEKIAMTTPVIEESQSRNKSKLSFVLPSQYTLETVPDPLESRVTIREVKNKKIAVLQFSGFYSDKKFEEKREELKSYLERDGISYSNMSSVGYNPPWTPPFMRRLEVWAEITP